MSLTIQAIEPDVLRLRMRSWQGMLAGYEVSAWFGIFAPAGVPQPVAKRLNAEFVKVMQQPDLKQRLASLGADPLTSTPEEFSTYLRSEIDKWAKVVKASGMKVD